MPQFQEIMTLSVFVPPLICFGMLLMGLVIFSFIYSFVRDRLYLTMSVLALAGAIFVFSESMILLVGGWLGNAMLGMQFHRMEQVAGALFLVAIPYMLGSLLVIGPRWTRANRVMVFAGLGLACGFIVIAFAAPDLYVSVTKHREDWMIRQADHGRGMQGPLYNVRDGILALMIVYSVCCFVVDMIRHRRLRYLLPSFLGLLLAIYGAAVDIVSTHTVESQVIYDIFPGVRYSRFAMGITLFILFSMGGSLRRFLDLARSTELANERAQREAEKNLGQNLFIRGVLKSSSETLLGNTKSLSLSIAEFTDNSHEQAAATEQISASIAGTSRSALSAKESAEKQLSGVENLTQTLDRLTGSTEALSRTVSHALSMINEVSENARSGDQSLKVMNESMQTIQGSSTEITGIIEIINDISDRINLLALNATIEAARAGEYGRSFAVVADEIGKLADATASSIKNINNLIRRSEKEIANGMQNTAVAVSRINAIIKDISGIVAAFAELAARAQDQAQANQVVEESAQLVKGRAEHITQAMNEQSLSIAGVSRSIESINGLSQTNARRIQTITESSRSLVNMVSALSREIEEFNLNNIAVTNELAVKSERKK
jgi:methyl-accepting chemotaxis protein